MLEQPYPAVLAHRCTWDDGSLVALHNSSADPVTVPLTLDGLEPGTVLVDLLQDGAAEPDEKGRVELALDGVRLPLAAGHSARLPPPAVTPASPPPDSRPHHQVRERSDRSKR